MEIKTLELVLNHADLGLEHEDHSFKATEDAPLTIIIGAGGDISRMPKIQHVTLDPALSANNLVAIHREEAVVILDVTTILGVERDLSNKKQDRRRTGFTAD